MGTHKQIYYQIVFGTKHRQPTIAREYDEYLYRYITGIIKEKNCHLYRINGIEDHVHIVSDLHPTIRLSDYVKDIKVASNEWIKNSGLFPLFTGWADGYGVFTYSIREKEMIINYVKNQKEHHQHETFYDEYKRLLIENGIEFNEKYMLE